MLSRIVSDGGRDYRVLTGFEAMTSAGTVSFESSSAARAFWWRICIQGDSARALAALVCDQRGGRYGVPVDRGRLIDELAWLSWTGGLVVVELPRIAFAGRTAAAEASAPAKAAPVRETSWVEFVVADDETGDPVPNVKLAITLPRKGKADHTTPASGKLDFDPCEPGACELASDLEGATVGDTLELVGMGDPSGAPLAGTPFPNKAKRPYKIARVERHRVRRGESLWSIAERAGMSWQALALFNFGTDSPKEINEALRRQVGCRKKTPDKKNYLFDDADEPGIVFIPRKLDQRGLATGLTHALRVRHLALPSKPFVFSF